MTNTKKYKQEITANKVIAKKKHRFVGFFENLLVKNDAEILFRLAGIQNLLFKKAIEFFYFFKKKK
jgi:hypothetical protein